MQTVHNSKTLDSYQSNVNVLQVSTDSSADAAPPANNVSDFSSGFQSDNSQNSVANKKDNHSSSNKGGKSGRPILGAGARLHKNRNQNNDSSDSWEKDKTQGGDSSSGNRNRNRGQQNNAEQSGNWHKNKNQKDVTGDGNWRERESNKKGGDQKKDWEKKKTTPKSKKGWEHDDRFETDYS